MEMVNLKDYVVALESGSRPKGGAVSNGIPSLGGEHINEYGGFNLEEDKLKYVPEKYFNSMKKGIIREGDILIVKDGATTGKCAYVGKDFKLKKACVNEHIFVLRVNSKIDPKYLFYYLYSPIGQANILKDFRGATVGGISRNFIDMQIFLPSLQIQHKTVQVLDKAQALIDKRKEQIKLCDELIQSLFYKMFLKKEKEWDKVPLIELCLGKGQYGSGASATEYVEGMPRYIRITDINEDGSLNDEIVSPANEKNIEKYILKEGDILFARTGATVGKTYKYSATDGYCIFAGYLIRFRPDTSKVNPEYIFRFTKTTAYKKWVELKQKTVAQPNINAKQYENELLLPLPPLELQNQFAEKVQKIEKQKQLLQQSLALLEDNFNSLMQKAFRGELFQ